MALASMHFLLTFIHKILYYLHENMLLNNDLREVSLQHSSVWQELNGIFLAILVTKDKIGYFSHKK